MPTVTALRSELRDLGLATTGLKAELAERLAAHAALQSAPWRQKHFIDSHKCATALFILACIWYFDEWENSTAMLYLGRSLSLSLPLSLSL